MASSQSFYNNEKAFQTTLKILMETTADVYFIFGSNNNSADFETDNGETSASKTDDGVEDMDSQDLNEEKIVTSVICQNEIEKIPANKQVLAALSPVFNAGMI